MPHSARNISVYEVNNAKMTEISLEVLVDVDIEFEDKYQFIEEYKKSLYFFDIYILAMDIPIKVIDVRPFPTEISGLETVVADVTKMEGIEDDSIESLSALCSLEHFGLGRYGDEVNPEACFMCFEQIQKKLKPGGDCYISVPIGQNQVQFNAHRIFKAETIVECFSRLKLVEFSCTTEYRIERNADIHKYDKYCETEPVYGLFWLKKEDI